MKSGYTLQPQVRNKATISRFGSSDLDVHVHAAPFVVSKAWELLMQLIDFWESRG